jgi:delta 1-pyrroline-5-carboxylate dehydrogenase
MDPANVRRDLRRALKLVPGLEPKDWTPPRAAPLVRVPSDAGVPVEMISQLVGHRRTSVTEIVHRHQIRPVISTGATVMDELFGQAGDAR